MYVYIPRFLGTSSSYHAQKRHAQVKRQSQYLHTSYSSPHFASQDTKLHYLEPLDVVILPTLSEGGKGQFWSDWSQQSSIRLFRYKIRVCGDRSEPYIGRLLYSISSHQPLW